MLCTVHINFHSRMQALSPRLMKRSKPSTSFICPNTGSTVMLLFLYSLLLHLLSCLFLSSWGRSSSLCPWRPYISSSFESISSASLRYLAISSSIHLSLLFFEMVALALILVPSMDVVSRSYLGL